MRTPTRKQQQEKKISVVGTLALACTAAAAAKSLQSGLTDSVRPDGPQLARLLHPWDFPGKSTGVVCPCLLQLQALSVTVIKPIFQMMGTEAEDTSAVCLQLHN